MNVQYSLIWELMLYEFEQGHNSVEATKTICCVKGEDTVDPSSVTRWFKIFHSGCKKFDDQARSGSPKTRDSKAVLQPIKVNLVSST